LISEPITTVEKLRKIIDLPEPQSENLPTFDDLREKSTPYGPNKKKNGQEDYGEKKKKFFRRGIAGAWKDELPIEYQEMFWFFNSEAMHAVGYTDGEMAPKANLTGKLYKFLDDHFVDQDNIEKLKNRLSAISWNYNE